MKDLPRLQKSIPQLLQWYENNARILPWREDPTPYRVWISEIMLQQTRVQAVLPYFERFVSELPDIRSLSRVDDDRLLKLWEGLGYYNRARNLKKTACLVMEKHGSELPRDFEAVLKLPGIGRYTAGAILSIAYSEPYPAVDGNVMRILTRLLALDTKIENPAFRRSMEELLKGEYRRENAPRLTQALMELGAMVCVPNRPPKCECCPWKKLCLAHQRGQEEAFPVRAEKKARRKEKRTILLIRDGERILLQKRPAKGLLAGMYEFPGRTGFLSGKEALKEVKAMGLSPLHIEKAPAAKHIFSHVEWEMTGYLIRTAEMEEAPEGTLFVELQKAGREYAFPSALRAYVEFLGIAAERG